MYDYTKYFFVIAILLVYSTTFCNTTLQNDNDSLAIKEAEWMMKRANKLGGKKNNDSVQLYFNEAKSIFKQHNDWNSYVKTLYFHGTYFSRHGHLNTCIDTLEKSLQFAKKRLNPDNSLFLFIYNNMGIVYGKLKNKGEAISCFEAAISQTKYIGDHQMTGYICANLSGIYKSTGNLEKALEYIEKAKSFKQRMGMKDRSIISDIESKAEILYEKKRFQEAKKAFMEARSYYKRKDYKWGLLSTAYYFGLIQYQLKDYDKAIEWFNNALDIIFSLHQKDNHYSDWMLNIIYGSIGDVYTEMQQLQKAHSYYLKSQETVKNKLHSRVKLNLAQSFLRLTQYDSALHHLQLGIINQVPEFTDENINNNPKLNRIKHKLYLLKLLDIKAYTLQKKYFAESKIEIEDLKNSFKTYQLTIQLIDILLEDLGTTKSKLDWIDYILPVYEHAINNCMAYFEETKDPYYQNLAFEIAEKSKAGVMLFDLKNTIAMKYSGLPVDVLKKEEKLKARHSYLQSSLIKELNKKNKIDTLKLNQLKENIFAINRDLEIMVANLEKKFPKYYQFKYDKSQITIPEIQNQLEQNSTVIEYFLGDSSSYVFIITKDSYKVKKLDQITHLDEKIRNLLKSMKQSDISQFKSLSNELYLNYFSPLEVNNQNLIIIPDGPLWYLNFDILISEKPKESDFKLCQYLIKDYSISYNYSVQLLFQKQVENQSVAKNECLAFSFNSEGQSSAGNYITMRGGKELSNIDLPGSRKEIKAISEVMDGDYYFGSFANEKNFKEKAKDYRILHLALHGQIDEMSPMNSKLYFTNNADSLEDNYLHAYELYNLKLNAELAVLSACNTGSGKLIKGEGVMSLGRAFTYAGCKSLLLSQWELSDDYTPGIIKEFYINLKSGKTKSESLRQAKLSYLKNSFNISANPYFWAALVQLGNNDPLPKRNYWPWILSGGLLSILIIFGFWKRKFL